MKTRIIFLVNGEEASAMGIRARSFAEHLRSHFDIQIYYRTGSKLASIVRFLQALHRTRPAICYVFDIAYSGVIAGLVYRSVSSCRLVVDTGDAVYELAKAIGRGPAGLVLTRALEWSALHGSDAIVVRSRFHRDWLLERGIEAEAIPDGVDTAQFQIAPDLDLRRRLGLENVTTIGTLGSLTWNPRTGHCYGLEILEVVRELSDLPLKGVIIGDGSGLAELQKSAQQYGIADRILFLGRIPYAELPRYLQLIDICVSTQTNDLPGQVRTTGKLPLYLAAGRFVLATKVGEAARILPEQMLVPYVGGFDPLYPRRLAEAVRQLLPCPPEFAGATALAQQYFDYGMLSDRLLGRLRSLLKTATAGEQSLDRNRS